MSGDVTNLAVIPEKAPKPADPPSFVKEDNLAGNEELVKWVKERCCHYVQAYEEDIDNWWEEVGQVADAMYRCSEDDTDKNQTDDTKANTGTSLFFRQVRVLAAGLLAILLSKKLPFRYVPLYSRRAFYKAQEGEEMADQFNLLAQWTLAEDKFNLKAFNIAWQLMKYGNLPVTIYFDRKKSKRTKRVPKRDKDGNIKGFEFKEQEVYTKNHPCFEAIQNENFFVDHTGGDIQNKPFVGVRTFSTINDLYAGARAGQYINIDQLKACHLYIGDDTSEARTEKLENRGLDFDSLVDTQEFAVYNCYLKIPLDDNGKLDPEGSEPLWYLCSFAGNLEKNKAVCLRIIRNPDPDDELPFQMLHALPDDDDHLYHMGYSEANISTYYEALTTKNQAIDQKNQLVNRPLKAIRGEVFVDNLEFDQKKIFWVENQNSIQDFNLQNVFPDTLNLLNYLEEEMNKTMGTDKPIIGEAMGGRTSATEAQNIFEQAMKPGMVLVKYVLEQLLPWYAKKLMRLWELYAQKDQIIEITGEQGRQEIKPAELYGEFDIDVDIVDEFTDNAMMLQNIQYLLSQVLASPQAAEVIEFKELMRELIPKLKITKNVARLLKPDRAYDAEMLAQLENDQMLGDDPVMVPVEPDQAHSVHIRVHKSELAQYQNLPKDERPEAKLAMLKQHILQHEQMLEQSGGAMAPPPEAPTAPGLPGELAGDAIAAEAGSRAGRPSLAEQAEQPNG